MFKKISLIFPVAVFSFLLLVLGLGTVYDLRIAQNTYIDNKVFVMIGVIIGKMPAFIILAFSFAVMYYASCAKASKDKFSYFLKIVYTLGSLFSGMLLLYSTLENVFSGYGLYMMTIFVGGAVGMLIWYAVKFIDLSVIIKTKKWAFISILVIFLTIVAIGGLKFVWGRPRFLDIISGNSQFSPWYNPNWFGDGSSFPSGHTGLAATVFLLPHLCRILSKNISVIVSAYILCFLLTITVAAARMVGGFHFMSDVAVASMIPLVLSFIAMTIYCNNDNYLVSKDCFLNKL